MLSLRLKASHSIVVAVAAFYGGMGYERAAAREAAHPTLPSAVEEHAPPPDPLRGPSAAPKRPHEKSSSAICR
jgi:hypothetical protein